MTIVLKSKNCWIAGALLFMATTLGGCQGAAFVAHVLKDTSVKPVYKLNNQPTVILVDDPSRQLDTEQDKVDIASGIGSDLIAKKVLTRVVNQLKVNDLRHGLGDKFDKISVDEIGRDVGAKQVIHVHIRAVSFTAEPGMIQPKATVLVKVIDVGTRKRLFPPENVDATQSKLPISKGGYVYQIAMRERLQDGLSADDQIKKFKGLLSDYIALSVGRLFYQYEPETGPNRP